MITLTFNRRQSDERGEANPFLITTIIFVVLAVGLGVGFGWAYMQMVDYRDNVDDKVAVAVKAAKAEQKETDDAEFTEEYKKPNLTYEGPSDSGSVTFNYPKTWATYIDKSGAGGSDLAVYFNPKSVPTVNAKTVYALRLTIDNKSYASILQTYNGDIKKGSIKAETITVGKTDSFSGYEGMRIDGQFGETINGSVVIFKIRDKTLRLYVDSQDFMTDFDTVLNSLKYES